MKNRLNSFSNRKSKLVPFDIVKIYATGTRRTSDYVYECTRLLMKRAHVLAPQNSDSIIHICDASLKMGLVSGHIFRLCSSKSACASVSISITTFIKEHYIFKTEQ